MWNMVRELRNQASPSSSPRIILEEAEEMADRISVINQGEIILVEDKTCSDEAWQKAADGASVESAGKYPESLAVIR